LILVVPCYNEERRLDPKAFLDFVDRVPKAQVLFVDDGSKDGTRDVLAKMQRGREGRVDVLALEKNGGKAEAVRRGMERALSRPADYVGYWDADLACPLDESRDFAALMNARRDVDIVFGSRVVLMGRTVKRNPARHYFGRVFATAVSLLLDLPIYDTQCGHKLFRVTPLLQRVFAEPFVTNWVFDVEILARFLTMDPLGREHVRASLVEVPLQQWIDVAGSKVKPSDAVRAMGELWAIRKRYFAR